MSIDPSRSPHSPQFPARIEGKQATSNQDDLQTVAQPVIYKQSTDNQLDRQKASSQASYFHRLTSQGTSEENWQQLLEKALKDREPGIALWLIQQKKAKLPSLEESPKESHEIIEWLQKATAPIAPEPTSLDHFALDVGLGYKVANSQVLQAKTEKLNAMQNEVEFHVPPFIGISDYETRSFLQKRDPEIFHLWERFLNESFTPAQKTRFLNQSGKIQNTIPLTINPHGAAILENIQKRVKAAFEDDPYFSPQIENWLRENDPEFLIIRSTGKEDSNEQSNAGGNESIPLVLPNTAAISKNIGCVVASYFSEKSISQLANLLTS